MKLETQPRDEAGGINKLVEFRFRYCLELGASSEQKCRANLFLNSVFIYPLCLIDNSFVQKDVRKQTKTAVGCWDTKGCCHIGLLTADMTLQL